MFLRLLLFTSCLILFSLYTVYADLDELAESEESNNGQEQLENQEDQREVKSDEDVVKNENSTLTLSNLETTNTNLSDVNSLNGTSNNSSAYVSCILSKTSDILPVEILNATRLVLLLQSEPNITNRQTPGQCIAVLFYSPSCPFSCQAAPHYNALPRFFPGIKMTAIDAMTYRNFNAQYGVVGIPTLMLFHNGRPAAKFNDTTEYSLETFGKFLTKYTGLEPDGKLVVTSADFGGPISSVAVKERDYYLILSWIVISARLLYSFYRSSWGWWLIDATRNAWREAEAQHHHAD